MHREYKIAAIGLVAAIGAAVIGLLGWSEGPSPKIVDITTHLKKLLHEQVLLSLVDIKLKNSGDDSTYIKRIEVSLVEKDKIDIPRPSCGIGGCHITPPSNLYEFDIDSLEVASTVEKSISHSIGPKDTDRIAVTFGASEPMIARIQLALIADDDTVLKSEPIDLFVVTPVVTGLARQQKESVLNEMADDGLEPLTTAKIKSILEKYKSDLPLWLSD